MRFFQTILIFFVLIPFSLGAAGQTETPSTEHGENTILIVDIYNRTISLPSPAGSIVSLSPGVSETIAALGYADRLSGRSEYCDFPPEIASVPALGTLLESDLERILSIAPDLVIASAAMRRESVENLEKAGISVAVLMGQPHSYKSVYDGVIRPVAALLGDPEAGEALIADMERRVMAAKNTAAAFPYKPTVYYVVGFAEGGDWTAGGNTFIGRIIEDAGAVNIASDVQGWSFSLEELVERDPEFIVLPRWALDLFPSTPLYSGLTACREGKLIAVDEDIMSRPGPRTADALEALVEAIGTSL